MGRLPRGLYRDRVGRLQHWASDPVDRVVSTAGGGLGAPVGSAYVVIANDATLTAERALAVSGLLTLLDGGVNSSITIGLAAAAIRPTVTDLTGASGVGPHALPGAPGALLVMVANLVLRQVGAAPATTEFLLAGANITLGAAIAATDPFVVWWWA